MKELYIDFTRLERQFSFRMEAGAGCKPYLVGQLPLLSTHQSYSSKYPQYSLPLSKKPRQDASHVVLLRTGSARTTTAVP